MIELGVIVTTLDTNTQSYYTAPVYYSGDLSGIDQCIEPIDNKTKWIAMLASFWKPGYQITVFCNPDRSLEFLQKIGKLGIVGKQTPVNKGFVKITALITGLEMTTLMMLS